MCFDMFFVFCALITSAFAGLVPQEDLIAHWDFEQNADNVQGNAALDGSLMMGSILTNIGGIAGNYLSLDGSFDYVDVSNQLMSGSDFAGAWSASGWFRADRAPGAGERFMVFETADEYTISVGLRDGSSPELTNIQFFTRTSTVTNLNISVEVPDTDIAGQWIHVTITYERSGADSTLRAYVNGVEEGSLNFSGGDNLPVEATGGFHIGTYRDANARWFPGGIDEVAVWNRTLTPAEIRELQFPNLANVTTVADDGSAGTLRSRLNSPVRGTQVRFDPGLAGGTIELNAVSGDLEIGAGDTVFINGEELGITIDADGKSRIFEVKLGAELSLEGLQLVGGSATGGSPANYGGAIHNDGGKLSLSACTLAENTATSGGAIYNNSQSGPASVILRTCTLSGNVASDGGAIFTNAESGNTASVAILGSTISGNFATVGGGVRKTGVGTVLFFLGDSILAGNRAFSSQDLSVGGPAALFGSGKNLISDSSGSNIATNAFINFTLITADDPKLAPLSHYGGSLMTMPPLVDSAAIDAAGSTNPGGVDQRGFSRFIGGLLDIGAVEAGTATEVGELGGANETLSLRRAIQLATTPGHRITFNPSLDGGTINLESQLAVFDETVSLDATNLANGITITCGGNFRILQVHPGSIVSLHGLELVGGVASGGGSAGFGGAIFNDRATLNLNRCTVAGNTAVSGGGIFNNGAFGDASLSLFSTTLSGNEASNSGGGISSSGFDADAVVNLHRSTITGNSAATSGGGIFSVGSSGVGTASLTLNNTILAGNRAGASGPDYSAGLTDLTLQGKNLISTSSGSNIASHPAAGAALIVAPEPKLTHLGDFGGASRSVLPYPGSPAINAAVNPRENFDQRNIARDFQPDIGATEFRAADLAPLWGTDVDGDGSSFLHEFSFGTDPNLSDAGSEKNPHFEFEEGSHRIKFNRDPASVPYLDWVIERSAPGVDDFQELNTLSDSFSGGFYIPLDPSGPDQSEFFRIALRLK